MASAEAGKSLSYFTFSDEPLAEKLQTMYNKLVQHKVTVGMLTGFNSCTAA